MVNAYFYNTLRRRNIPGKILHAAANSVAGIIEAYRSGGHMVFPYKSSPSGFATVSSLKKENNMTPIPPTPAATPSTPKRTRKLSQGVVNKLVQRLKNSRTKKVVIADYGMKGKRKRFTKTRRTRKVVKRKYSVNFQQKGVAIHDEHSGSATGKRCVYLGHTSVALDAYVLMAILGIIKSFYAEHEISVTALNATLSNLGLYGTGSTKMRFFYFYKTDPGETAYSTLVVDIPLASSVIQAATLVYNALNGIASQQASHIGKFININFDGVNSEMNMFRRDISLSSVKFNLKQHLKVQNVTLSVTNQAITDIVDKQPLESYQYKGNGNYLKVFYERDNDQTDRLYGDAKTSVVRQQGNLLTEPIKIGDTVNVKRCGKFFFQPGTIVSDNLYYNGSINMARLFNLFVSQNTQGVDKFHGLGKYSVLAFEKMIDLASDDTNPVKVNFELARDISCYCIWKSDKVTRTYYDQMFI